MKRFTKLDKRLLKLCELVREHLGLQSVGIYYGVTKCDKDCTVHAWLVGYEDGWRCHIEFHRDFFELEANEQIDVVIHEHIHAAMVPMDSAVSVYFESTQPDLKKYQDAYRPIHVAREIVVDRLTGAIRKLLEPHLRKL